MKSVEDYKFASPVIESEKPQVVQAMSGATGSFVAVKYFPPTTISRIDSDLLQRTIPLFASLNHTNIVKSHGFIHNSSGVFHVMDWCEGRSLRNVIETYKHVPERLVALYTSQVLQGLDYLHSQGITHGNLKASNVLVMNTIPKLTDFGLSAAISHLTLSNHPYWSAPEVLDSELFSNESDIWSLGCIIIELMTGHPPFHDLPPEQARAQILSECPTLPPNASQHLCDFLLCCFNRNPRERASAKELMDLFWITTNTADRVAVAPHPVEASPRPPSSRVKRNESKPRSIAAPLPRPISSAAGPASPPLPRDIRSALRILSTQDVENFEFEDEAPANPLLALPHWEFKPPMPAAASDRLAIQPRRKVVAIAPPASGTPRATYVSRGADSRRASRFSLRTCRSHASVAAAAIVLDDDDALGFRLRAFAEGDGEDLVDFELAEADDGEGLEIRQILRPPADFAFLDVADPEEQRVFERSGDVEAARKKLVTAVNRLGAVKESRQLINILRNVEAVLREQPLVRTTAAGDQTVMRIVEVLQFASKDDQVAELILPIVFELLHGQQPIKENFCLLGGIPPLIRFLAPGKPVTFRRKTVEILTEICSKSSDNTQMFVACNGLSALISILSYDRVAEADMICISIQNIVDILRDRRGSQKWDFCRLFVQANLLEPMVIVLEHFANIPNRPQDHQLMLDNICELNNKLSQADGVVRKEMSNPSICARVRAVLWTAEGGVKQVLPPPNIVELCKSFKSIGMDMETRDNLSKSSTLEMACEMLKCDVFGDNAQLLHIRFYLLDFLDEMCKLSKQRTGIVASTIILPRLRSFLVGDSQLQPAALRVILALAAVNGTDQACMERLLDDHLIETYLDIVPRPYWGTMALQAISNLSLDRTLNIAPIILREESLELIRQGFVQVSEDHALSYLSALMSMCQSVEFINGLVNAAFGKKVVGKFGMQFKGKTSQIPASLLELLRVIFKSGATDAKRFLVGTRQLKDVVTRFVASMNIREKTFANEILQFFRV